jgi:type IV pilus assembly protein PilB
MMLPRTAVARSRVVTLISMSRSVIVATARTPFGKLGGGLAAYTAPELGGIAIEAALTGHLVLSTLHTNDAPGAVTRLVDMGVEPFMISASLEGVLGQRLIRKICPECKSPYEPSEAVLAQLGLSPHEIGDKSFYYGVGCEACNSTGYKGRKGIYELLNITDPIRDLINKRAPSVVLKQKAIELGMTTLRQDGLRSIYDGETTIEEVLKYT